MKDNNLTHKFWARAVAFCLFCVMTAILACCIAGVVYCYSKEWYKTGLNVTFTAEGDDWGYYIDGANAVITDKTGLKELAYKNRNSMMVYGFIAGITALACFVFLICSAAHRSGTEDCVLLRQDKMPYDLYLPSAILLGTGLCAMLVECVAYELNTVKAVTAALILACLAGVFMALCMTTAARIKTGTLFKNTLIYRLCTGVGMGASSMLSSISGAWRFSLAFAGYLLINALLSYRFFTRGGFLTFLLLIAVNGGALYFLLYRPVKTYMDGRRAHYAKLDEDAKSALAAAEQTKETYAAQLKAVDEEIARVRAQADEELHKEADERRAQAQQQADEIVKKAQAAAAFERERVMEQARSEVSELMSAAAEKLVLSSTSDAYDQFLNTAEERKDHE